RDHDRRGARDGRDGHRPVPERWLARQERRRERRQVRLDQLRAGRVGERLDERRELPRPVALEQRLQQQQRRLRPLVLSRRFRPPSQREQEAVKRVFGTIFRAESIVDDWMDRIVAAIPQGPDYESMRAALMTQEHDEWMHRGSLLRVATEVLGIPAADADRVARKYNNFVAEILFDQFEVEMQQLLRPNRPLEDVYTAIFIYGVISEDVVANSDVVIRRGKGRGLYDTYDLPGMKVGQTKVRRDEGRHVRIAVLATHRFLEEFDGAAERLLSISSD